MSEKVSEVTDSSFEKDVLQSSKPVLVDFWAAWCAPCRMLAPTIDAIAEQFGETLWNQGNPNPDSLQRR